MIRVAVFGGGMGGLSAAFELIERGFEVDVYERRELWGGKARSYGVHGTGTDGRPDLPAEHGFRFFPGFYKHVPDSMSRIPYPRVDSTARVLHNLVDCTQGELLQIDKKATVFPVRFPRSWAEFKGGIAGLRNRGKLDLKPGELRHFVGRLLRIAVACDERRMADYEKLTWWSFVGADTRSAAYKNLLARGVTRSLVAMRAETASTRTVGDILLQMVYYVLTPGATADRVLNGPTNQVWVDPWRAYLKDLGVRFHDEERLVRLELGPNKRIARAIVQKGDEPEVEVIADHYVSAVPCEVMATLVRGPIANAAPSLRGLAHLQVQWMNGVQFYLARDYPMVNGHSIFANSTWSLTSISQAQFWKDSHPIESYGDGRVKGLLSVDISDWTDPGMFVTKERACDCERETIIKEAWRQALAHLQDVDVGPLRDEDKLGAHLDHDIEHPEPGTDLAKKLRGRMSVNALLAHHAPDGTALSEQPIDIDTEPLLVNTVDSWALRPEAKTEIANLFLASDYVRTHTDLATMEGANEAGRRAVNALLDATKSSAPRCDVWPLKTPWVLAPFRAVDWVLFQFQKVFRRNPAA